MTIGQQRHHDASTGKFCPWCGGALVPGAGFCPGCGCALVQHQRPENEATEVTEIAQSGPELHHGADSAVTVGEEPADVLAGRSADTTLRRTIRSWTVGARRTLAHPRHRWLVVVGGGLALLLVAGAATAMGYRYFRDRPVHEDFQSAQRSVSEVVRRLSQASDLEQLAVAGDLAARADATVTSNERGMRTETSTYARAAHRVLVRELVVLRSAASLKSYDTEGVVGWGRTHQDLVTGLRAIGKARAQLASVDEEAATRVPASSGLLPNLEGVVGRAVASTTQDTMTDTLARLADADGTERVRALAGRAVRQGLTIEAALTGVDEASRDDLKALREVYDAIAALSVLDADHLDEWGSLRGPLLTTVSDLGPTQRTAGRGVLTHLDDLVRGGQARLSEWRQTYKAAAKRRSDDAAALEKYRSKMDAQMHRYSALRVDLSDWIAMVEEPSSYVTWSDAYTALYDAEWQRQQVVDAMTALDVPQQAQNDHAELVAVIDDAIEAVRSANSGVSDAEYCTNSCYYKDTPGWTRFSAESERIAKAYGSAVDAWETMISGATAEIQQRPLPEQPRI